MRPDGACSASDDRCSCARASRGVRCPPASPRGIHPDAASSALRRPLRDQSAGYGAGLDPFGPVLATQDGRGAARYGASVQARVPVARRLQRGQRACTGELWAAVTAGWDAGSGECSGAADGGTASAEVGGAVLTLSTAILTMAGSS